MPYRPKLIEVALPLDSINEASAKEKSIRHGHPSTLHLWWARRPLAACRAVLFGQLVDDPSGWPEEFPTEEAQDQERERLFDIIRELVVWENSNNPEVLYDARLAIARTFARRDRYAAGGRGIDTDSGIEMEAHPPPEVVSKYLVARVPPVHDPFAGGGSIPLEAQRLGLRAIATDLNPVAILINRAMIELPTHFLGQPPVNPDGRRLVRVWRGTEGLAEDVRYYGAQMRDAAFKRIGHNYPEVTVTPLMAARRPDLVPLVGTKLTVIAWIWARTVVSPNPAAKGVRVPLVTNFWLGKKPGKECFVNMIAGVDGVRFEVRVARPGETPPEGGTKSGRGDFRCVVTDSVIPVEYIRQQGVAGRLGAQMMAMVAEGRNGRIYLSPDDAGETAAAVEAPADAPDTDLPVQALGFRVQNYGLLRHRDLFTNRQLVALCTLCDEVHNVYTALIEAGQPREYAEAISTYLAFAVDKVAEASSTLATWSPVPKLECVIGTFRRHALPMTWDFAEVNPFAGSSGSATNLLQYIEKALRALPGGTSGTVTQQSADDQTEVPEKEVLCTDPPYYDNVPYADLSDYLYIWLRRSLVRSQGRYFRTLLVPKADEMVADPARFGGSRDRAAAFFEQRLKAAFSAAGRRQVNDIPICVFYAFRQAETEEQEESSTSASTGWETMLEGLLEAGFCITGTMPIRTERPGRTREQGSNALASSIVLTCRLRDRDAPNIARSALRRMLREELPAALRHLQHGNIAPVDVAQAAIGPGMGIYSRHSRVLEADGRPMTVRTALQLINEALDEFLSETEGDLDADTRFAVTWFETHAYDTGLFGEAETLAKARNVSVSGVAEAGILSASAGKVRLLRRPELLISWNPVTDKTLTVWEATQHLIKRLEEQGEGSAADLLHKLGPVADQARALAYRLYSACERRKWAEEARAYNGLVVAWPELERLAAQAPDAPAPRTKSKQETLF